ncbi:isochorismatase family protein [Streptomyces sp. NBRC 110611]|uniref:cysteine hydrolase family protein n=1 Tax=Streptomyces sp. NBRC 110611 TaxID=1621259 RepID=UPI0008552DB6|nr:cysteine hydrolase family protein [Streptomyces sp. NBRC 110611]GAU69164.1 isochorismatase family protein [Streptomyces sp. NBRC 110611]
MPTNTNTNTDAGTNTDTDTDRKADAQPDIARNAALVVIDVQKGFDEEEFWGPRNNPAADQNIAALITAWQETDRPVVFVRHDSPKLESPLRPGYEGNDFKEYVQARRGLGSGPELLVTKTVNSAFYGTPDLHAWFEAAGITQFVVAGIQTNMCAETTARMGGNLGYQVLFPLDATHTFDLTGPFGWRKSADELATASAISLHGGGFAKVVTTTDLLTAVRK